MMKLLAVIKTNLREDKIIYCPANRRYQNFLNHQLTRTRQTKNYGE